MATCPEGMWPAVYEVNGETERERVILNIANNLPNKYQKECKLQLRPVLLTSPQPTSTALSDVRTCVTAQDAQAKNTTNPAAAGHLGTCVYTDMELAQLFIRRVPVRRKGQQVYTFNGTYYRPLTESELHMDLPYGSLHEQAVGMIKSISGSDAVTVEAKYRTPYTAKLDCKLVFGTNHPIRATVADKALARRLMILPFTNPVPKSRQDSYLLDRLLEERPAILERAVQAYYRLRANNYVFTGDDRFDNDAILGITDGSAVLEDVVEQFVDTCCVDAPGQFVSTGQLYEPIGYSVRAKASAVPKTASHFPPGFAPSWRQSFRQREARDVLEEFPAMAIWECS